MRSLLEVVERRVRGRIDSWVRGVASRYGYREYMVARYVELLGGREEALELLNAFEGKLLPSIRCNTLKVRDCSQLLSRLERLGYGFEPVPWEGTSFRVVRFGSPQLGATHEFLAGMYYLYRGAASLIPPVVLSPGPSDLVLDLAAAPGGKTTHLAQLMGGCGAVVAIDVSRSRMRALRSNLERLGVANVVAVRMDGCLAPRVFGSIFTKVLLDAPCTAEGLIQVDPDRKQKTSFSDLVRAHERQVRLLNAALDSAFSGAYVLYCTCSIAPEEGEFVIAEVLEGRDDFKVVPLPSLEGLTFTEGINSYFGVELPQEVSLCGRIYPHTHGMEGFFLCLMRKY